METKEYDQGLAATLILYKLMYFRSLGRYAEDAFWNGNDSCKPMERDQLWDIWREALKSENGDGPEPSEVP